MPSHEIAAPDAASRYRTALLQGAPPETLAPLAAELDDGVVRMLHLIREASSAAEMQPSLDFARELERDLLRTAEARSNGLPPTIPSSRVPVVRQGEAERGHWRPVWRPRDLGAVATVGMLLLTLVATLAVSGIWHIGGQEMTSWQPAARNVAAPESGRLELLWESRGGADGFRRAYGLAVDPEGRIWTVDWPRGQITILNADGSFQETWGEPGAAEGQFNFLSAYFGEHGPRGAIDFDRGGNLYVVDTGNFRVQKFAPDRGFLLAWGSKGEGDGQFLAPAGIAIDASGHVYVSDAKRNDIQVFDGEGAYLGVIGKAREGPSPMTFPVGIAVDGEGNLWQADFGDRVRSFAPDGALLADWGVPGTGDGELTDPSDVAVDAAGRVYVVDQSNRRLQVFTPEGQFLAKAGGFGAGPGFFNLPASVAIDEDGIVYVSDRASVQAFRLVMGD